MRNRFLVMYATRHLHKEVPYTAIKRKAAVAKKMKLDSMHIRTHSNTDNIVFLSLINMKVECFINI